MPYNFASDSFHFAEDFLKAKCDFRGKTAVLLFWAPQPLGDLGATYDNHLRLVGKRVGDFLLVLIELFSLGRTTEALRVIIGSKIGDFAPMGAGWPKISDRRGRPTNHSSSQETRLNYLSDGIKIWTDFSSVLSQSTRLTDGGTDKILIVRPRLYFMQHGKKHIWTRVQEHFNALCMPTRKLLMMRRS